MNRQTYALLSKLLDACNSRRFTYQELADTFGVSTRTIRNYIASINEFLATSGNVSIETNASGEVGFSGTFEQAQAIRCRARSVGFYEYRLSQQERQMALRLMLLCADDFLTLTDFSQRLYSSRGSILRDIEAVVAAFNTSGISFDEARHKGYRLVIGEADRRELLKQSVSLLGEGSAAGVYQSLLEQLLGLSAIKKLVYGIIAGMEAYYDINLEDAALEELTILLVIYASRAGRPGLVSIAGDETPAIFFDMAAKILKDLNKELGLPPNEVEIVYLAKKLFGFLAPQRKGEADISLHIAIKIFLYRLSAELQLPLALDERLQQDLVLHISSREGSSIRGCAGAFIEQYSASFAAVRSCSDTLQSMGYCRDESELTEILVMVLTALERYYANVPRIRVLVVCNAGTVTANFLTERLKRSFNMDVLGAVPLYRLEKAENEFDIDMIVSTIPIESATTWVQVSPTLTQDDMGRIQSALNGVKRSVNGKKQDTAAAIQGAVFDAVACGAQAGDWREAIRIAGELLVNTGKATQDYIEEMIKTVERHGPYIVFTPGIALAHAEAPSGSKYCASLVKLENTVEFGHEKNDPVRYVIAAQTPGEEEHLHSLFNIMNLMCSNAFLEQLDSAHSTQELINIINN